MRKTLLFAAALVFCTTTVMAGPWERYCAAGDTLTTNPRAGFPCLCVVKTSYCVVGASADTLMVDYFIRVGERQIYVNPVVGMGFWADDCKQCCAKTTTKGVDK